ncbi:MAG TPA: tRNA pseudouridine(38-40) synthase TruA, partial [Gammaproteobacteria bacterium]|nr:tRNA pseudouridine(38-40) synthase TruA [Gammaproteobacteria bacterium]
MTRIVLGIEYDGHDFHGWQTQDNLPTIQRCLENALTQVAAEPVHVFCAGRTDAGVHAIEQIVHFDTKAVRDARAWVWGTNTHLPPSISVRWTERVDDNFHARFSARARCYQYLIYNHSIRPAILARRVTWHYEKLNADRMQQAGNYLIGEKDFTSFRSSQCESKTPMRDLQRLTVKRHQDFLIVEIKANAFLHHMVRNIVGILMEIGEGKKEPEWIQDVL